MGHAPPRPQPDRLTQSIVVPWKLLLSCVSGALGFAAVIAGSFSGRLWLLFVGFAMIVVAGVIPIEPADRSRAHPKLKKRQQSIKPDPLAPIYAAYELDRITLEEFERCIDFELRKQEGLPQPREHGTLMHHGFVGADWHGTLPEFDSQGRLVGRSPLVSDYVDADYAMRPFTDEEIQRKYCELPRCPAGVRFLTDEEVRSEIANDAVDSLGRPWGDQLKRVYR